MKNCTEPTARKYPPKPPRITEQDIEFISFSLDEHIRLVERHLGCTWEHNVREEKKKAYHTVSTLHDVRMGKVKLDEELLKFIEFTLTERCDFATEGFGETWCKDGHYESAKTAHVLKKLRKLCSSNQTTRQDHVLA